MIDRPNAHREKRLLQLSVAVAAFVPIAAGVAGVVLGPRMLEFTAIPAAADSHFRYLAGILLALGLAFWSTIPAIERKTARFRMLAAIVVIGGLARALSLALAGMPTAPMLGGLVLELGVTPLLALWQARVARRWLARP